jgi:Mg/Co/Ni transporter MgtE
MIKKEIFIGFIIGILANSIGILLYILLFSDLGIEETIGEAIEGDFFGILIAAGAILNFVPFFLFIKKDRIYRARGVLMASIFAALAIAVLKIY